MINLLHIADLHVNNSNFEIAQKRIEAVARDLRKIRDTKNVSTDLVVFGGDIVQAGSSDPQLFNKIKSDILAPLLSELNLTFDKFCFSFGNHEVNRDKTSQTFESGLVNLFDTNEGLNNFYDTFNNSTTERSYLEEKLSNADRFLSSLSNSHIIRNDIFSHTYMVKVREFNIGVLSLNSAWLSSQYGEDSENLRIIPRVVEEALDSIKGCDIILCAMHHPIEMLPKWNAREISLILSPHVDVVFSGHIHESDYDFHKKILGGLHLVSCNPILDMKKLKLSGYNLFSYSKKDEEAKIFLRRYYPERKEYDQETEKIQGGLIKLSNFHVKNDETAKGIKIARLKTKIFKSENETGLQLVVPFPDLERIVLADVFVEPLIANISTFDNDQNKLKYFKLDEILEERKNIIFYAGKEYGKTTLLNYLRDKILTDTDQYYSVLPVMIDFSDIHDSKLSGIVRKIAANLGGVLTYEQTIEYLKDGAFCVIIDDYDGGYSRSRPYKKRTFKEFYNEYPDNQIIVTRRESLAQIQKQKNHELKLILDAKKYYLRSFNTSKIRAFLEKWNNKKTFDVDAMLKQIVFYFHQLRIPVTPMTVSLFLGVLFKDKAKKNLKNEAYLVENYLENLLEKSDLGRVYDDIDYRDKERFLSHFAIILMEEGVISLPIIEFEEFKVKYFKLYDEEIPPHEVFDEMFSRGILVKSNERIQFKFKFMGSFYLARAMQNEPNTCGKVLQKDDFLAFDQAISYKAGLSRDDEALIKKLDERLTSALEKQLNPDEELLLAKAGDENLLLTYSNEIEEEIKTKNNKEEKDKAKDEIYLGYEEADPEIQEDNREDDIIRLLTLTSDVLKNTTKLKGELKVQYLKRNIQAYVKIMWLSVKSIAELIDTESLEELLKQLGNGMAENKSEKDEINYAVEKGKEIILQIIPVSTLMYMNEHLSNPRLKNTFYKVFEDSDHIIEEIYTALVMLNVDFSFGLDAVNKIVRKPNHFVYDNIIYLYIIIYCYENNVTPNVLDALLEILRKIRENHASTNKILPAHLKETFISDLRHRLLVKHQKQKVKDLNREH